MRRTAWTPADESAHDIGRDPHLAVIVWHPGPRGGMETFARFVTGAAVSAGWNVTLALSGHDIYTAAGLNAHRPTIEPVNWVDEAGRGDRAYGLGTILQRRAWFRRIRPDVALFIQSSNTPLRCSVIGAGLAGVPVVMTHRTMPWIRDFCPSRRHLLGLVPGIGLHNRRIIARTRLAASFARHIVYNSQAVRRAYEHDYHYPRRKGCVIPNAVTTVDTSPIGSDPRSDVVIGYFGRLGAEKQVDLLLLAFGAMRLRRRARLVIYGSGPEAGALRTMARDLSIEDRVAWHHATDDPRAACAGMDVVALCSRRESSSNMVLEAMAAGKAVVVSDAGGLPELVNHGECGVCLPAGDVPALAETLDTLVDDTDLRRRLGERARARAAAMHAPNTVGRAWLDLLRAAARVPSPQKQPHTHRAARGPLVASSG